MDYGTRHELRSERELWPASRHRGSVLRPSWHPRRPAFLQAPSDIAGASPSNENAGLTVEIGKIKVDPSRISGRADVGVDSPSLVVVAGGVADDGHGDPRARPSGRGRRAGATARMCEHQQQSEDSRAHSDACKRGLRARRTHAAALTARGTARSRRSRRRTAIASDSSRARHRRATVDAHAEPGAVDLDACCREGPPLVQNVTFCVTTMRAGLRGAAPRGRGGRRPDARAARRKNASSSSRDLARSADARKVRRDAPCRPTAPGAREIRKARPCDPRAVSTTRAARARRARRAPCGAKSRVPHRQSHAGKRQVRRRRAGAADGGHAQSRDDEQGTTLNGHDTGSPSPTGSTPSTPAPRRARRQHGRHEGGGRPRRKMTAAPPRSASRERSSRPEGHVCEEEDDTAGAPLSAASP